MLNAYCPGNQHITNWLKPLTKTRSKRALVCCVILVATSLHCFHFFLFLCAWLCNWMKGDQKTHSKCIYNLIFPNVRNFEFWWILVGILESDAHKEYDYPWKFCFHDFDLRELLGCSNVSFLTQMSNRGLNGFWRKLAIYSVCTIPMSNVRVHKRWCTLPL